jgi:galactitol-specific phosphotransferase system IIB component
MTIKEEIIEILKKTDIALTTQQISLQLCNNHQMDKSDTYLFATEVSSLTKDGIHDMIMIVDPLVKGRNGGRACLMHDNYKSVETSQILLKLKENRDSRMKKNWVARYVDYDD